MTRSAARAGQTTSTSITGTPTSRMGTLESVCGYHNDVVSRLAILTIRLYVF